MSRNSRTNSRTDTPWQVRDSSDEIVATFATEPEAFEYGSHLANANPDECYGVYYIRVVEPPARTA